MNTMNKIKKLTHFIFLIVLSQSLLTACNPGNIKEAQRDGGQQQTEDILQSVGVSVSSVDDAVFKAEKALQSGKTDLAQLYFIKAYELEPNNVSVLQKMADLYTDLKKYALAEVSLKLILQQQPENLKVIEQYGLLLIKLKNYQEAEKNLNRVIAKQRSWPAYNGLGIIASLEGDYSKAESLFKTADGIMPNSPELLNNIGFTLYSADKLAEAAPYYVKALQINPGFKKAIYNYALLQARLSNYEQAQIAFAKVSSPEEANNNTGYIAMMNGDYTEANNYLQEAINASPRFYKKASDNLERLEKLEQQ
jgi:tetratricopeptide (TPR) repeat protein